MKGSNKHQHLKKIIKYLGDRTVQPLIAKYLSVTRKYTYNKVQLTVPPEVFHPGFFFSSKLLLKYILTQQLNKRKFLELGAGSGLIAFSVAKKGALTTATDINPIAIEYLKKNSQLNNLPIQIILSDLFQNIPIQVFDIIAINPPYYKKQASTEAEFAWYCGTKGEYFLTLFKSLKNYIHPQSLVLMVLSEECDLEMIKDIAAGQSFILEPVQTKKVWWEINFIFKINRVDYTLHQ